jgi:hypothetical protein
MAKVVPLYNEAREPVNTLAIKSFAEAKDTCDSIPRMPKSQLRDFLNERIGPRPKLTAMEVSKRGGISYSYISELKDGKKDPASLTVDAVRRLAKGLNEPPVIVFLAAMGKLKSGLKDEYLHQLLEDFSQLDNKSKGEFDFMIEQFRRMIDQRLNRNT